MGSKNFTEEYVLGELYSQALKAKGFSVKYKQSIGATEVIDTALTSGKINIYPEYVGEIDPDRLPQRRPCRRRPRAGGSSP